MKYSGLYVKVSIAIFVFAKSFSHGNCLQAPASNSGHCWINPAKRVSQTIRYPLQYDNTRHVFRFKLPSPTTHIRRGSHPRLRRNVLVLFTKFGNIDELKRNLSSAADLFSFDYDGEDEPTMVLRRCSAAEAWWGGAWTMGSREGSTIWRSKSKPKKKTSARHCIMLTITKEGVE